jgi:GNAT superfamily N-acetyltransferase
VIKVVEIDLGHAADLEAAMGHERELIALRRARGCRCFGAWIGDSLVGYGWLSTKPEWIGEVQLEIKPRAGEGYIWNCATVPEFRRQGTFRAILTGIMQAARNEGMKRLWLGTIAIPAEKAVAPSGFKPAVHADAFSFAGFHWLSARAAPEASPSLVGDASDVLSERPGWHLRRSQHRVH